MLEHRAVGLSDMGTQDCGTIWFGDIELWDYRVLGHKTAGLSDLGT